MTINVFDWLTLAIAGISAAVAIYEAARATRSANKAEKSQQQATEAAQDSAQSQKRSAQAAEESLTSQNRATEAYEQLSKSHQEIMHIMEKHREHNRYKWRIEPKSGSRSVFYLINDGTDTATNVSTDTDSLRPNEQHTQHGTMGPGSCSEFYYVTTFSNESKNHCVVTWTTGDNKQRQWETTLPR